MTVKLIIPRKEWTGTTVSRQSDRTSNLCKNMSGERCCLGHYLVQTIDHFDVWSADKSLSMPHDCPVEMRHEWLVNEVDDSHEEYDGSYYNRTATIASNAASALAHINDDIVQAQELKEAMIAYTFEMYDVDVTFVD